MRRTIALVLAAFGGCLSAPEATADLFTQRAAEWHQCIEREYLRAMRVFADKANSVEIAFSLCETEERALVSSMPSSRASWWMSQVKATIKQKTLARGTDVRGA